MNIWWFNQYAGAPNQAGHTRNYSLAYYLKKQGHQVTLISSDFNHFSLKTRLDKTGETFTFEEINGVEFLWVAEKTHGSNYLSRLLSMFSFARLCRQLIHLRQLKKPDIIIGSSPSLIAAHAACKIAKTLNVPFVLEVRDIWPLAIVDLKNISAFNPLIMYMKFLEKRLYQQSAGIIAAMPYFSHYLIDEHIKVDKLIYIPHGIDYDLFKGVGDLIKKDKFVVIHAGKFAVANHLVTVLEAAQILKQHQPDLPIEFWLIGDGPDKAALELMAENKQLVNVKFFAPLPKDKIYEFMQQADAFLLHVKKAEVYRYGATTNRLSDYLASGRPLIYAFSSNSYDPVTLSGCGVSIQSEDPKALANAAVSLYLLPFEEHQQMGQRAVNYVKEHHNLEHLSQDLGDFLQQFV